MRNLYYTGCPRFKIGNTTFHMLIVNGQRTRGKTSVGFKEAKKWWEKDKEHNKFIYLRRKEKQLQLALSSGLFNGSINAYPDEWKDVSEEKVFNRKILLKINGTYEHFGYCYDLNNVKGISIEDANLIIFDEFVEPLRSDYKGGENGINEPELFARLLETVFRKREYWVIMYGNFDSPTNPYFEYFNIPFNANSWSDKNKGILYMRDVSEDTTNAKKDTVTGKLFQGTRYESYSEGQNALGEVSEFFITDNIPSHATMMYNMTAFHKNITIWYDENAGVLYFTSKRKFNNQIPMLSVTSADMSIDRNFVKYSLDVIDLFKSMYGRGRVRFNSQETATIFLSILSIK